MSAGLLDTASTSTIHPDISPRQITYLLLERMTQIQFIRIAGCGDYVKKKMCCVQDILYSFQVMGIVNISRRP